MTQEAQRHVGMVRLIGLVMVLTLFSCGAKKVVTNTETKYLHDTIVRTEVRNVFKEIKDTITIESPCDSLGVLRPFKSVLKTDRGNISISSENGSIQAKIALDSIVQSIQKDYQSKTSTFTATHSEIKTRNIYPKWLVITLAISLFINFIFIKRI